MHQDPEHEDYDDDEYNYYPEYNEYGYPNSKKFDVDWAAWEQWLSKAIKDIVKEDDNIWVIGSNSTNNSKKSNDEYSIQNLSKNKYFMYLGKNNYEETIWKKKYFVKKQIEIFYKKHISSHSVHFLKQPHYYKSMFDILN